jgi:biotin synthase
MPELDYLALARRVIGGGDITRGEAEQLFAVQGEAIHDLLYAAYKVRRHFHANRATFCSIVASKFGNCSEDCQFCAQSAFFDTGITPHAMMGPEEVKGACTFSRDNGASAFGLVNSGRGPSRHDWHRVKEAILAIKEVDGICHCATLGELTVEQAHELKALGIRRINHNIETSREFYPKIVTTHTWDDRVRTLKIARDAGLELCSGCIFGMGEGIADRVSIAFSLKELNPSVVPLNFLYPIPGTPLSHVPPLPALEILKIIGVMRLILPHQDLKIGGGREKNLRDLQSWIFYAGATSAIIGNYLATFGRTNEEDLQMVRDLGLTWHDDRVGDLDPAHSLEIELAVSEDRGRFALPLLS